MDQDVPIIDQGADALPPHLLNQVNKDLTGRIQHYETENERVQHEIDEHKSRLKFMVEHLTNVKQEILNTQQLHEAKRREIETEDHMAQLAERERGRLFQQIEQLKVKQQELQDQIEATQNRIFQGNLRMDNYKAAMSFNQEELEQWDLARRQKEDDGSVLEKYSKADEGKLKHLNLNVEKLSKIVQTRRNELETEITETRSAQIELDKTAEDYKAVHTERQYLLGQWEEAVKSMHRRDNAIKAAGDQYSLGKENLEKQKLKLKKRQEFLQIENANNKDKLAKIEQEERVVVKWRSDHAVLEKHLGDLEDEVEVLRNTLAKAVKERHRLTAENDNHQRVLAERRQQYNQTQKQHERIIAKFEDEIEAASNLERQNQLVADLLAETEKSMKALDKEMTRIKDEQYKRSQELFEVRRAQSSSLAEISGAQAQGRNMAAKISQLDGESFKQQELLYSIEFNVQQMERKVNRAKGERTEEEKRELQKNIELLQKMLEDLEKQHKVLDTQVTRVADDLRQSKYETVQLEKEKQRVNEELLELTLENDSCSIELNRMTKQKEEALVTGDVLKLQVQALKHRVNNRDKEMLGLENRKEQLNITIHERELEIKVHHDVLKMECKTAEDERRVVSAELAERRKQVAHLKSRYEVLMGRMDPQARETTNAQHIVKTAKEREELQAAGDKLDVEIKRVEREAKKVEKTISLLQASNAKFKGQFNKVGDGDDEVMQQKELKTKSKDLQGLVNRRTNEMKEYMRTEMSMLQQLQDRKRGKEEVEQRIQTLHAGEASVQTEIDQTKEMIARYDVAIGKMRRATNEEIVHDIELAEQRDKLDSVVAILVQMAGTKGDEVLATVTGALERSGFEVPADVVASAQAAAQQATSYQQQQQQQEGEEGDDGYDDGHGGQYHQDPNDQQGGGGYDDDDNDAAANDDGVG